MHNGKLDCTDDQIMDLFRLGFCYKVLPLLSALYEYAKANIHIGNCVQYEIFGTLFDFKILRNLAFEFMKK